MSMSSRDDALRTHEIEPARSGANEPSDSTRRVGMRMNALASAIGHGTFFAATFLTTPIAIRHLGDAQWGIWQIVGAATQYALILSLGLGTAIQYQVSYLSARQDYARLATAFTSVRLYFLAVALAMGGALAIAGLPLLRTLVDPDQVPLAWQALLVTVGLTAVTLPIRFYQSVLGGLQRFDLFCVFQLGAGVAIFAGVSGGFRLGMGLTGFALVMGLCTATPFVASWLALRRMLPRVAFRWVGVDLSLLGSMVTYSLSTTVFLTGTVLLYQTMKFLASWACGGTEAAGRIGLVINIVQTIAVVFTPLFSVVLSRVAQLHGEGRLDAIAPLLNRVCVLNGLAVVPTVIFLGIAARSVFEAWLGSSVSPAAVVQLARTTQIMLLGQAAYALTLPGYHALLGVGEHRAFGMGMLAAGSASVALGWVAARAHPEIESLALAFSVAMVGLFLFVTLPVLVRRFTLDVRSFLGRGVALPALASLPGAVALGLRPRLGRPLLDLIADAAIFGVALLPWLGLVRRLLRVPAAAAEA